MQCLESCVSQDYPNLEIVVVANGCSDGTAEQIEARFPGVRMIRTETNVGFFPAVNIGVQACKGDYVLTIDDDARLLSRDAIREWVRAFQREPDLGAATCCIEGPAEPLEPPVDRYVSGFKTGFTMMPRRVFTEWVGYYPDIFFRSGGEYFMATALWDSGHPVKKLAGIHMWHERSSQGRSDWDWKFHGLRSQILAMVMRDPWYLLPLRTLSKALRSLVFFLRAGHGHTWAQAWKSAVQLFPYAWRLRRPIRWPTQVLLWRLRRRVVTDRHMLGIGGPEL